MLRRPPSAAEAGSHSLGSGEARPALLASGADSDAPAEGLARDERVTRLPTSPRRSFYYRCQCHLSHYHLLSLPSPSYQIIIIITIISVPSTRSLSVLHITISNPHHHHHYYTPLSSAPHYHHSSSFSQVRSALPPPLPPPLTSPLSKPVSGREDPERPRLRPREPQPDNKRRRAFLGRGSRGRRPLNAYLCRSRTSH